MRFSVRIAIPHLWRTVYQAGRLSRIRSGPALEQIEVLATKAPDAVQ